MAIGLEPHLLKSIDIDSNTNMLNCSPFNNIDIKLLHLIKRTKANLSIIPIDINIITAKQYDTNQTIKTTKNWKSGTGYGSGNDKKSWDVNNYIDTIKVNMMETIDILKDITDILSLMETYDVNPVFESYIISMLTGINILDFNTSHEYYHILITLINVIVKKNFNISNDFINNISNVTNDLYEVINNILSIDISSKTDEIDIYINTYIHFIDTINTITFLSR